jgi:Zn-dependent protease with chaperone function
MAKRAYKIVLINKENISELSEKERLVWSIIEDLSDRNHIKMPEVGIYIDEDPNAFAT